jgi:TRAP-type C4-dicarboxylate transport system substrate-binding protein
MRSKSAFTAISVALGLYLASPVQAQDKWDSEPWIEGSPVTMKLGYNTVRQYPHARAIERFVNRVAERTGENFQIQTFPSEQAGNERAMLESLILGNLDMAKVSTGVISAVVPEFGVFDLPYVFRDLDHMMKTINSPVGETLAGKLEEQGVKVLFWMEQGISGACHFAAHGKKLG